jgi:hypothetical protein
MRRHISSGLQPPSLIWAIILCIIPDIIWDIIWGMALVAKATTSPPPIPPRRAASTYPILRELVSCIICRSSSSWMPSQTGCWTWNLAFASAPPNPSPAGGFPSCLIYHVCFPLTTLCYPNLQDSASGKADHLDNVKLDLRRSKFGPPSTRKVRKGDRQGNCHGLWNCQIGLSSL